MKNLATIFIVLVFIGCTSEKHYHEVLNFAEDEMKNNPQKALAFLDSLQRKYPDFPPGKG